MFLDCFHSWKCILKRFGAYFWLTPRIFSRASVLRGRPPGTVTKWAQTCLGVSMRYGQLQGLAPYSAPTIILAPWPLLNLSPSLTASQAENIPSAGPCTAPKLVGECCNLILLSMRNRQLPLTLPSIVANLEWEPSASIIMTSTWVE